MTKKMIFVVVVALLISAGSVFACDGAGTICTSDTDCCSSSCNGTCN